MKSKHLIREEIREKRAILSEVELLEMGSRLQKRAIALEQFVDAEFLASYISTPREAPTGLIHTECFRALKRLAIPYSLPSRDEYGFCGIDLDTPLHRGPFGIFEPREPQKLDNIDMELAFVPGIAFSRDGIRLGYGKGIYDRLLQNFKGIKIGLSFSFQCYSELPAEEHDICMDFILTESEFIEV